MAFTAVIMLIFIVAFSAVVINSQSKARSKWVFVINDATVGQIIEKRHRSNLPDVIKRLLYNRATYFVTKFTENYVDYFSPKFLFRSGGTNYQLSVPGRGLIYPVNLAFFYIGLGIVIFYAYKRKKEYIFILLYLLLAPIPAAVTIERFAVIRSTAMLPFTEIVISLGVIWTFSKLCSIKIFKNAEIILLILYLLLIGISLRKYLNYYFGIYTTKYSWVWQYGYKQLRLMTKVLHPDMLLGLGKRR